MMEKCRLIVDDIERIPEVCRNCVEARRRLSIPVWKFVILCLVFLGESVKSENVGFKKDDPKLIECHSRCLQKTSPKPEIMASCQDGVCSKCVSYCSLLIKKSQIKRKLVCDRDSHICSEGCREACSFFGFMENETYDKNSDVAYLKKKMKKGLLKLPPVEVTAPVTSTERPTTSIQVPDSPMVMPDWRISLISLEKRGPIVQAGISWEELSPSPTAVFTPDPVLAYLGMANGKYRLHWSCPSSNLEGQLVTDSASATISMWLDCEVLVNVELLGYNIQSPSIIVDTNRAEETTPSSTPSTEVLESFADTYSTPVRFESSWLRILCIIAASQAAISVIAFIALISYRKFLLSGARNKSSIFVAGGKPTVSCITVTNPSDLV